MFFFDPSLSELPAYITIASCGQNVLSHGHYEDYPGAIAWCARAMQKLHEAEQISIARPTVIQWEGYGKVPGALPVEGWVRGASGWEPAHGTQLLRAFERVEGGPRTLLTEPPDAPGQTTAPGRTSSITRLAQPPQRDQLVEVLRELTATLKQWVDRVGRAP